MRNNELTVLVWLGILAYAWYWLYWRNHYRSGTAFGSAAWATERLLRSSTFSGRGLILGRTLKGALIRLPKWGCHTLLVGGTGAGKGVGVIIPNLLTYYHGFLIVHDTKGDLYQTVATRRARTGNRIIRIAPFSSGTDGLNPLDAIPRDSPVLIDSARALAEALVVRGNEHDQHWNDKAVQVLTAIIVLVLLTFNDDERNLCSVQAIASDIDLVQRSSERLLAIGGIPARLGSQMRMLFDGQGSLTK